MTSPFTPWAGGPCPLSEGDAVLVIRRRFIGDQPDFANGRAGDFDWEHNNDDPDDDVVAYRQASPTQMAEGEGPAGELAK